ncbi:MAG TPA: HAMP domain-containing sensor histidine kinase [Chryseolinea sp.]|nr:HAMP domain-containing sensor histidine kinase [Chryseolinea sp.]HPM31457.1 HAMP domain-containing sensor histidine kinase [Chryseolinea sp.]
MENSDLQELISALQLKNRQLEEREEDLADQKEELHAQKEELTAAIEELVLKNNSLADTLQQLQKRNQELDQILYRASHDLKTPVSSLKGLLDLMRSENLTPSQTNLHTYMNQKVSQMNDVLKSLTMFAEASFEKIEMKDVSLKNVTEEVLRDLSYLPNYGNVNIAIEYNNLHHVQTDELVLYNILKCLISNSITYRDPIKEGNVWVHFSKSPEHIHIKVSDDGEGISMEISNSVFDMFFRGSERSHGQGLGLYIVKSVMDRMKGEVSWISESNKTTFQISLPQI